MFKQELLPNQTSSSKHLSELFYSNKGTEKCFPFNKILQNIFISALIALCLISLPGCAERIDYGQYNGQPSTSQEDSSSTSTANDETNNANSISNSNASENETIPTNAEGEVSLSKIPEYSGKPYIEANNNEPVFTEEEKDSTTFESYAPRDYEGRCGTAFALVGHETMPTEERESISEVKPTGWQSSQYDFVEGESLYNRCHLIGFQLTGENANWENLITGTRYLNTEGMLPFENEIDEYVEETNNHVLYRVTPLFNEDELVARGVHMEAYSVEDNGAGVCFNIYCYNVQPGVEIDYQTGDNWENKTSNPSESTSTVNGQNTVSNEQVAYILNTNSKRFHYPDCSSVDSMAQRNKEEFSGTRDELIAQGYKPCSRCNP